MGVKRILFPNDDFKYKMWAEELTQFGFSPKANKKLYPNYLFLLLGFLLSGKRVYAVVFRYLNDRQSFIKTFANAASEFLIIRLCKIFKIRIFWIMHNVDKESIVKFPSLNSRRRSLVMRNADKVFVLDHLLIDYAVKQGVSREHLDSISFGLRPKTHYSLSNNDIISSSAEFKQKLSKSAIKKVCLGICVSSAMSKFKHFLLINDFVNRANDSGEVRFGIILIGKFPQGDDFSTAEAQVRANPNILHINKNEIINLDCLAHEIDFFYRSVDDLSISYSVYDAAKYRKPIFTHTYGLLPELVTYYRLGFVIPDGKGGLNDWLMTSIDSWDSVSAENFLTERTWIKGAEKLVNSVNELEEA